VLPALQEMTNSSQDINYIHHELTRIQQQMIQKLRQGEMTKIKISRNEFVTDDNKYFESYGGEDDRQYRMADEKNSNEIKYLEDMYSSLFLTLGKKDRTQIKTKYIETEIDHVN